MRDKNNGYLNGSNMTQNKNNDKEHENMSKEQKISKTNCTNGCIVQNNMTAIDKEKFIFKK